MTYSKPPDMDSLKYWVPLYLKGKLSPAQREELERALQESPLLREEMKSWREIEEAYRAIEEKLPPPPAEGYFRITQKIQEVSRPRWLEWFRLPPAVSFALVAAQLIIILMLGIYSVNLRTQYQTLSTSVLTRESPAKVNVVFKEDAPEAEIRSLLLKVGGKIIDGPGVSGLYIIGMASDEDLQNALQTLRQSKIVEMAERTYP